MPTPTGTIDDRWRLYRRAREDGNPEVEAYDRYLHPRSRISDEDVAAELTTEQTRPTGGAPEQTRLSRAPEHARPAAARP